jgi:hypothetical protein
MRFQFDREKFKQMMLYVISRCESDESFGATKLNKIMFYADVRCYVRHGAPITGAEYQKLPKGPAPRALMTVREELQGEGKLFVGNRVRFGYAQTAMMALAEAELSAFLPHEIAAIDHVIDKTRGVGARDFSEYSHEDLGWRVAEDKETIPYEAALFVKPTPTEADREFARGLHDIARRVRA